MNPMIISARPYVQPASSAQHWYDCYRARLEDLPCATDFTASSASRIAAFAQPASDG